MKDSKESVGNPKTHEIYSERLMSIIDEIKWENWEQISYNGTDYLLFLTDEGGETVVGNDVPAFYTQSSVVDFDVYIVKSLPLEERKRMLFHELLEANLRSQGLGVKAAHEMTLKEEENVFGKRSESD